MPRKKKRDDLIVESELPSETKSNVDLGRQPRIVGWLVLIAGSFSTWYWYRPLPSSVNETLHSTPSNLWRNSEQGPKSIWTNGKFDIPDVADLVADDHSTTSDLSLSHSTTPTLLGNSNVALIPRIESPPSVHDVMNSQAVPYIPPVPPMLAPLPSQSQVRTESTNVSEVEQSMLKRSKDWPDVGYVPEPSIRKSQKSSPLNASSPIPPLLEAGMRTIRESTRVETKRSIQDLRAHPVPESLNDSSRQPQFIRQPKP